VLTISDIGCGLGEVNILDSEKSVPVGGAIMPIFVLNHLPESSIKSSTLSLKSTHCHYTDWSIKYRTIYISIAVRKWLLVWQQVGQ